MASNATLPRASASAGSRMIASMAASAIAVVRVRTNPSGASRMGPLARLRSSRSAMPLNAELTAR